MAGYRARSIDGPCHNTIPPYNHYVVLGPLKPDQVAKNIAARVGYDVAIVDINDLGPDPRCFLQGREQSSMPAF